METVLPHRPLFIRFCLAVVVVLGLLLHPAAVWCVSSNDDTKTTEVEGVGPNRDLALKDAWRNAVENTVGGFVASATVVKNHQLIEDYILAYADGYIEDFDVLGEGYRRESYWIKIMAKVKKGLLLNTLKKHNINIKGESLYATLMTNKQAKKNRVEICKLELGKWDYPEDFATVSCDHIEVIPDTGREWFRFSSSKGSSRKLLPSAPTMESDKPFNMEVAYLKASNCTVEVNDERIDVYRKWKYEAIDTNNKEMRNLIRALYVHWPDSRSSWWQWHPEVGLRFYNKNGKSLYEARATSPFVLPIVTTMRLKNPRVTWGSGYIKDCYIQGPAYYPVPLEILKRATKIQPLVVRQDRGEF